MKYSEMEQQFPAEREKRRRSPQPHVHQPAPKPAKAEQPNGPRFRLFRLTKPMNDGCTHAGEVWISGRMWTITAKVVETEYGRQFHGNVEAPGVAIRKGMDPTPAPKNDLVSQAEGTPFDDPLPGPPF